MNKSAELQYTLDELADKTVANFADKAGVSKKKVKKVIKDMEKGISKNIDKDERPSLFFGVLVKQVKKKLGIE